MPGRRDVYEKAVNEGISFAWDQHWDKAIASYRIALEEFPDDPSVLSNLGQALLALNKQKEALIVYQRAARVSQGDPIPVEKCAELLEGFGQADQAAQAYFAVGELYAARRDIDKAIENWNRCVLLSPKNLNAYSRLSLVYEKTGKIAEAVASYIEMARLLQVQGDIPKAIQLAQRAIQVDPQSEDAAKVFDMIQRGESLPEPRRVSKASTGMLRRLDAFAAPAIPEYEKKSGLKESEAERKFNPFESGREFAMAMLAESLFDIGDVSTPEPEAKPQQQGPTGFLRLGSKLLDKPKSSNRAQIVSNLSQAIEAQTQGDIDTASSLLDKTVRAGMDNAALYYILGANYLGKEKYEDAIKNFLAASKNSDYGAGAHYGLGICYGRTDRMNDAINHLISALLHIDQTTVQKDDAGKLKALYDNFVAEMQKANPTEEDLIRVGENLISFLSGRDWQERVKVSRQQLDKQNDGELVPLAQILLIPGADRIMESMAMVERYMASGWWPSAMDEAHRALEASPLYLPAHIKIAEILVKENRLEEAVSKYTTIATLYNVRGEGHRTAEIYEEIARLAPMDINARAKLIEMLTAQGKTDEAVEQYLEMGQTYYELIDLDNARKTYATALALVQRSRTSNPALAMKLLLRMGDIDMQKLDWRQAMVTYAQVKTIDAANEQGRSMLASLYLRTGQSRQAISEVDDYLKLTLGRGEVARAIKFLEIIIHDHPEDVTIRSRLARIYQETGRKADAINQLDAIGEAQLQAGNRADAIKTIQSIIDLNPENLSDYQQILSDLQAGK